MVRRIVEAAVVVAVDQVEGRGAVFLQALVQTFAEGGGTRLQVLVGFDVTLNQSYVRPKSPTELLIEELN